MIAIFAVVATGASTAPDNQTVAPQSIIVISVAFQRCTARWTVQESGAAVAF